MKSSSIFNIAAIKIVSQIENAHNIELSLSDILRIVQTLEGALDEYKLLVKPKTRKSSKDNSADPDPKFDAAAFCTGLIERGTPPMRCMRAPDGWTCSRKFNHSGPCAAKRAIVGKGDKIDTSV